MKRYCRHLAVWIFFILLASGLASIRHYQASQIKTFSLTPTARFRKALIASIRLSGAVVTYRKLSDQLSHLDYLRYHSAAHVFGATVFQLLGNRGVAVCDDKFVFGCFHGFSIVAIKYQGVAVIPKLMTVCKGQVGKARGSCLHGIGHGLGEYFGPDRLEEQLAHCAEVDDPVQKSCPGGVIMQYFEYYSPNSLMPPSVELAYRPYDQTKPYGPCPTLPAKYQNVCYFMLPGWWWFVIAPDASVISNLCHGVENLQHRDACFQGSGVMIAQVTRDNRDETVRLCREMKDGELRCRAGATAEYWLHTESHDKASTVCDGLPEPDRITCLTQDAHIPLKLFFYNRIIFYHE